MRNKSCETHVCFVFHDVSICCHPWWKLASASLVEGTISVAWPSIGGPAKLLLNRSTGLRCPKGGFDQEDIGKQAQLVSGIIMGPKFFSTIASNLRLESNVHDEC